MNCTCGSKAVGSDMHSTWCDVNTIVLEFPFWLDEIILEVEAYPNRIGTLILPSIDDVATFYSKSTPFRHNTNAMRMDSFLTWYNVIGPNSIDKIWINDDEYKRNIFTVDDALKNGGSIEFLHTFPKLIWYKP